MATDVITTTDDVIQIICIDLEGKLMCCLFLGQKILHFKFIFWNSHGNIDATVITQQPNNMLLVKVSFYPKIIS